MKYIIIDAEAIQKRIEELEKELTYHQEWYKKARENYDRDRKFWRQADDGEMQVASGAASTTAQEIKILKELLSQSTSLIPEIEKAWEDGRNGTALVGNFPFVETKYVNKTSEDYISNLKLDI